MHGVFKAACGEDKGRRVREDENIFDFFLDLYQPVVYKSTVRYKFMVVGDYER